MSVQLDLFGAVEAAEQEDARRAGHRAQLLADRHPDTDLGYALIGAKVQYWMPKLSDRYEAAWNAARDEMNRGSVGELIPGAPGSCTACDHHQIWHHQSRWWCGAPAGCACREVVRIDHVDLRIEQLDDGSHRIRPHAEIHAEAWWRIAGCAPPAPVHTWAKATG